MNPRLLEVLSKFIALHQCEPEYIIRAPGRINLIGEHTDYNQGWVLPAAIDKAVFFAVKRNDSRKCNFYALDIQEEAFVDLPIKQTSAALWINYLEGACKVLEDRGHVVAGFDCVFGGDIPIGAGLSSSAALDCGMIMAISLTSDISLSGWDIVEVSHKSNNDFLGIQSGILDQFASVFGASGKCMSLDCRSRSYSSHDIDMDIYEWVLFNTNVKHQHSTSGYNDRPAECRQVVTQFQQQGVEISSLRDLHMDELILHRSKLDPLLFSRAKYIIEENKRVHALINAMADRKYMTLCDLLYASYEGLQHLYEVSCDELDLLVDLTRSEDAVLGSRMMGGGFGGCTLNLIKSSEVERVTETLLSSYRDITSIDADMYKVAISNGLEVIN